ncbi:DUF4123 domain-containing protein [Herbaspirillum sp. SJZ107]|uniref:DUF4123 domain-containing protein n=1 Tax=Herbaspirillum sp. SJZ107 TaxID=2572881 RepID=UPI00114EFD8A|nr:DUF4123 domain-containing protein [Herbaspirillum sp. SJZ107]TQK10665.1 uncharacterized protein DUF4123 [Herbaspirillum sp. SJZ107]
MNISSRDHHIFEEVARGNGLLRWYAIADSAQQKALPFAIQQPGFKARCLFDSSQRSPVAAQTPHLAEIGSPLNKNAAWRWISNHRRVEACITVIATELDFKCLWNHLSICTECTLPDGDAIFLAFWDPAVLGSLIGQPDDHTLHVKGPVLRSAQKNALFRNLKNWWYWDRLGTTHSIDVTENKATYEAFPIRLSQDQVDDLVEGSVPDHILYYIESNQPTLISDFAPSHRYEFIVQSLAKAREIELSSMKDLVNFVCLKLIYRKRIHQEKIVIDAFEKLFRRELAFHDLIDQLP